MSLLRWRSQSPMSTFSSLWDGFEGYFQGIEVGTKIPAANILEEDKQYLLELAVPGYQKKDFNIQVNGNTLVVALQHKEEKATATKGRFTRREFSYESFQRSFQLPTDVNTEGILANYESGLLKIALPKKEAAIASVGKRVEVK